jgi:hypothetical protein
MREKAEKILDEMPIEDIMDFLDHVVELNQMIHKYAEIKAQGKDADDIMVFSIAYHVSKIVDKYIPFFKSVEPMKDFWKEINEEVWEAKISGRGKTLC